LLFFPQFARLYHNSIEMGDWALSQTSLERQTEGFCRALSREMAPLADGNRRVTIVAVKDDRKALPLPTQVETPSFRAVSRGLFLGSCRLRLARHTAAIQWTCLCMSMSI
jgi:hypothetical protein